MGNEEKKEVTPEQEEVQEVFECEECGREFDSQRGLSLHMKVHEEPEEKTVKTVTKKNEKTVRGQTLVTH